MNNNESELSVIQIGKAIPELFSKGSRSLEEMYPKTSRLTKLIATLLAIGSVALIGYTLFAFALPIIGYAAGAAITVVMAKPAWKFFTALSDKFCKLVYQYNPGAFIEKHINSYSRSSKLYSDECAKIRQVAADFETQADAAEEEAEQLLQQLEKDDKKYKGISQKLKEKRAEVARLKADIDSGKLKTRKERAPYQQALNDLTSLEKQLATLTSNMTIRKKRMKADQDRVETYASKSHIFGEWIRFLDLGATVFENRRMELSSWWEDVQKNMMAAKAGKDATDTLQIVLRDASGKSVSFEEACKAITNEINTNYARTAQNMADLQKFVDGFDMDSAEAWDELEKMLEEFKTGEQKIPMAAEITNPSHKLTPSERKAAGILGNLFDE